VVEHAFADAALTQIVLGVVAENEAAVSAYRRAGFREYGTLERCFHSGDAASTQLFMVRERE
jgi:RimJ/RimL family protein N-acetyltransferase